MNSKTQKNKSAIYIMEGFNFDDERLDQINRKTDILKKKEDERYKNEIEKIYTHHNFKPNDTSEIKSYHDNDMKYYLKIVHVHHKFIDRMYSKYPSLTNSFNKLRLEQILNKREFNC